MTDRKHRKNKIRRIVFRTALTISVIAVITGSAFAAEGDQFKDFYIRNADILITNNLFSTGMRSLGWAIVKKLVEITDTVQTLYDKSFGFIDMTTNPTINEFVQRFKPAFVALTALALLYLGFMLIMKHDKKPDIGVNICIAVLCVSCSTFMFGTLNGLAHSFKTGVDSYSYKGTDKAAITIIDENMTDVLKLYKKYGTALKPDDYKKVTAGITEKNYGYLRINSVINYASDSFDSEENPFKYRIAMTDANGDPVITENDNGWGINDGDDEDFGNEFYYRYKFDWLSAFIQLVAVIIVYVAMAYKCVRVAFELVVARLLAYLYSAELSGGEKIKKILCFIRDSYILLGVTAICIKLYAVFTGFIHSYVGSGLVSAIFSIFLAFTVIDGPNLVEKLLGMDAGLRSSTARMMAIGGMALGAGRFAGRTGNTLFRTGSRIHEKIGEIKKGKEAAEAAAASGAAGAERARDAMDKGTGKEAETTGPLSDKDAKAAIGTGSQDNTASVNGSKDQGVGSGPDFMDKTGINERSSHMDPGDRMDQRMERSSDSVSSFRTNRELGSSGSNHRKTSMPERKISTKSRYTQKREKGDK